MLTIPAPVVVHFDIRVFCSVFAEVPVQVILVLFLLARLEARATRCTLGTRVQNCQLAREALPAVNKTTARVLDVKLMLNSCVHASSLTREANTSLILVSWLLLKNEWIYETKNLFFQI